MLASGSGISISGDCGRTDRLARSGLMGVARETFWSLSWRCLDKSRAQEKTLAASGAALRCAARATDELRREGGKQYVRR